MPLSVAPPSYTDAVTTETIAPHLHQEEQPPTYHTSTLTAMPMPNTKTKTTKTNNTNTTTYIQVAVSQSCTYMVRSDGVVDRTTGRSTVHQQLVPPEGAGSKFVFAAADNYASYLLTDKGVILRTTTGGKISLASIINPPPGHAYIKISSGPIASYFVLSNGVAMRWCVGLTGSTIQSAMTPSTINVKYIDASAGIQYSYLLRSDGFVDKVKGGKVIATLVPQGKHEESTKFVGLGQQLHISSDKGTSGPYANYLRRSDGVVERITTRGTAHQLMTAASTPKISSSYVDVAAGGWCSYLIRDDGVCCRTVTRGRIQKEMIPEKGTKYIQAAAGAWASYILRSDGAVVRTVHGGEVNSVMFPPARQAKLERTCT